MESLYPESFARFYDVIYHTQRDGVDNEYFLNEIKKTKGKVLEAGVGTGRLFTSALKSGADVYGLDISPSMIEILKQKLNKDEHKRISHQNIIDFRYDLKFDLIIAPFRVMMHLLDKNEQISAINNAYEHLNEGGRFIFDAFIPDLRQLINGLSNVTDFEGEYAEGKKIKRIVSTVPDLIRQVINVKFHLEWEEDDGIKQSVWITPLRYFFRYELEHLVERSRFKSYRIAGDYEGNELNSTSREFIVICTKTRE
jgi:SAM-dependent methyltransferase